ncbi:hypothetical protein JCM5353_000118 [Sporobolomyces roseus]
MSSAIQPLASTSSQLSPPPATLSSSSPTIHVYYSTRHVKARIDPGVPLPEIIRQLVSSSQLSIGSEPSTLFCLRLKETGQLLTSENFHSLLSLEPSTKKNVLILGSSPEIEAIETLDKLSLNTSSLPTLKLATFSLKTLIKDKEFRKEFLDRRNGWETLIQVVGRTNGNTLAYALNVVRDVLELDTNGGGKNKIKCESRFVKRVMEIVATQPLINISRPATQIIQLLLLPSSPTPFSQIHPHLVPSSSSPPPSSSTTNFLPHLVSQLPHPNSPATVATGDHESLFLNLSILTLLLRNLTQYSQQSDSREETDLMSLETFRDDELVSLGLYQILAALSVEQSQPFLKAYHESLVHSHSVPFDQERDSGLFDQLDESESEEEKWTKLGPEQLGQIEYSGTTRRRTREEVKGFVRWFKRERERGELKKSFGALQLIEKNDSLPEENQIRFLFYVSSTITRLLINQFHLTPSTTTPGEEEEEEVDPMVLELEELHRVLMRFWIRLWSESDSIHYSLEGQEGGGGEGDFEKISELVRGKFQELIKRKKSQRRKVKEIEKELESVSYKVLRLEEIERFEMRDELIEKPSIKRLRSKIYSECFSFVRTQRLAAFHTGIWVRLLQASLSSRGGTSSSWRLMRLGGGGQNQKGFVIEWIECSMREKDEFETEGKGQGGKGIGKGTFDELVERRVGQSGKIEIGSISHITSSSVEPVTKPEQQQARRSNPPPSSTSRFSTFINSASLSRSAPPPPATTSPPPQPNPSQSSSTPSALPPLLTLHFTSSPPLSLEFATLSSYSELHDSILFLLDPTSSPPLEELTEETLVHVESLTSVGLRVKLLDLTGDGIEVLDEEEGEGRMVGGLVGSVPDGEERFFYREYI